MIISGRADTKHASKYVAQLCKHWAHRFDVELGERRGRIALGSAAAVLEADVEGLSITLETDDPASVEALKATFAKHLDRFAFREAPLALRWSEAPAR